MHTDDLEKLVVGIAVVLLLFGALFLAVALTSPDDTSVGVGWGVAAFCTGALGWLTWRDVSAMSRVFIGAAIVSAPIAALLIWITNNFVWAIPVSTLGAIGFACWRWPPGVGLRHELLATFPDQTMEYGGIHFVIEPMTEAAGPRVALKVRLENCWTQPRVFVLEGASSKSEVRLEGLEVTHRRFLVEVDPSSQASGVLFLNPRVRGWAGRRGKPMRAHVVEHRVSDLETGLTLLTGTFVRGGGLRVPLRSSAN